MKNESLGEQIEGHLENRRMARELAKEHEWCDRRIRELEAALRDTDVSCANVHHKPSEYHEGAMNCPVVKRIKALLTAQETEGNHGSPK